MARKKRGLDEQLAALRADPEDVEEVRTALRSTTGILVARGAQLVAEHRLDALVPELAPAFERLLADPKRDPGCRGKVAIARALHALDHWDDRVLVAGLRVEQIQGIGKLEDDVAAELRGVCGIAHAHTLRSDALDVLADLLADRWHIARLAAAQGLGDAGRPDAAALLRFKIRLGDEEAAVLSACMDSLLGLARDAGAAFLVELLDAQDERAEVAAIALGGARVTEACEALLAWCDRCDREQRLTSGFLALALLRHELATDHLLAIIRDRGDDALAAARALATFKDDAALRDRIRDAAKRSDTTTRREIDALLE